MIDVSSGLNKAAEMESSIQKQSQTLDAKDSKGLVLLQQEMGKMQVFYGTLSAMISAEKQAMQGIIQKMA
ncbi:MAG: EscF/YscF/HrpA family type III secretion system needle major subunit [Candidatus Competibacteraceae bacterium]